jgi:glycerophosphoryl diester phosphodiesterase
MYDTARLSLILLLGSVILFLRCTPSSKAMGIPAFDKQGHRGCRGLMPENTIPAMIRAIDLGVTTLEMDVVISKDKKVVLSHDPRFSSEISTRPGGQPLTAGEERNFALYQMNYHEIRTWDVGMKPLFRFPRQQKIKTYKPLLEELVDSVEAYIKMKGLSSVQYNIETKSSASGDGVLHPGPEEFTDLLMEVINKKKIGKRTIVQSFDERTLRVMHKKYPGIRTSYLIEGTDQNTVEQNISKLGFKPDIYSPEFRLVTPDVVKYCRSKGMKLIVWTVNDLEQIRKQKALGVDGIISDYPDLFNQ